MLYLAKTPAFLKLVWKDRVWEGDPADNAIYLTFDDGPHPEITGFVLDELAKYQAKASFFCIGKNVESYPDMYRRIIEEGHVVGNHTYDHLNGWATESGDYLENVAKAIQFIDSDLFRPPYGRITGFQEKQLREGKRFGLTTVMWSVISGDFDPGIKPERCLENVLLYTKAGSIVVFHDSEKAKDKLVYALPKVLAYFSERGFRFKSLVLPKKNGPG